MTLMTPLLQNIKNNLNQQSKKDDDRPIVVIDGMNIFIRMFCARMDITTSGDPVGGVVGVLKFINRICNDFYPKKLYIVWEQGGPSPRRKKIYSEYKANRVKDKDSFKDVAKEGERWIKDDTENKFKQLHLLTNAIKHIPVCQLYIPDTEADDVVAYLVKFKLKHLDPFSKKIIVSSDKDFYQLLDDPKVEIFEPSKKVLITGDSVKEKFGIAPRNFCLARSLVGDTSDNIDGIPGVGLKTVAKRLPETLDDTKDLQAQDIIDYCQTMLDEKSKIKVYQEIVNNQSIMERNWQLMYLDTSAFSSSQIQKIDYIVDNFNPQMDKLAFIKSLMSASIVTDIDFDRMSIELKRTLVE